MSYNDNDNDNSYGSSGRQGGDAGYGAGRSYGDDDVGRESGVNADGSYGSSRNEGLGDSSYGSSNRAGGGDSYGSSNTYGSSGRTGGDSYGSSDNYNDNRNLTEKAKDKLSSDRTDRPDDPVSGTNYGQSDSYGSGNNTSSYGDSSYGGNDNRGLADKAKDKLSSDRSDRPDNPVTGRNFDQDTSSSGYGGNNTSSYGDSSYGGNDNRGLADKAKDKLSSDRSDRPDNPVTGRNFDQDTSSSGYGGNNNSSSNYGSSGNNDNRGIGEKIKDKLSSKRSDQPDDPISGTNYGEDSSRGSSGGGLMDKVKAKIGGSGNNRNDNDSYGSSGNTYGGSDSYGSGNNNDRNY